MNIACLELDRAMVCEQWMHRHNFRDIHTHRQSWSRWLIMNFNKDMSHSESHGKLLYKLSKKKKKKSQTGNKCWDSLWHPVQAMLQQTFNFAHVLFYCLFHRSMSVFNVLSRMEKPCQFLMEFQFHELPLLTQQTLVTRGSRPGEVNLNTSDWLPSQLPQAHFTSDLPACIHSCSSAFPLLCLLRFFFFKYISAIR